MRSRALLLSALVLLAVALPGSLRAHIGGEASIIVPLDHVNPGESFPVIASDLGGDAEVTFSLVSQERTLDLGRVTAGPDGHFQSTFNLPRDFPLGYSELVASSDDGSRVSTWVLIGPRTESAPTTPNQPAALWQDPAVLLLSGVLLAGGLILALTTIRSGRRERVPVGRKARRR